MWGDIGGFARARVAADFFADGDEGFANISAIGDAGKGGGGPADGGEREDHGEARTRHAGGRRSGKIWLGERLAKRQWSAQSLGICEGWRIGA